MEAASPGLLAAQAWLDRFGRAFRTFDGHEVAALFATPGVALRRDGTIVALTTKDDVVHYYQDALDHYRRDGCRSARWRRLETVPIGRHCMLATVSWELLRDDETTIVQWRQSYCLRNLAGEDHPKAFASAMHSE